MPSPQFTGVTIEQYLSYQAPPEVKDELIEGEIILSPSPMPEHADICARLYDLLTSLLQGSPFLVRQDTSMRLSNTESMPRPDVFAINRQNGMPLPRAKRIQPGALSWLLKYSHPRTTLQLSERSRKSI